MAISPASLLRHHMSQYFQHFFTQRRMQDFFQKDCWRHHPKPYADYMEMKQKQDEEFAASKKKLIPGMA